MEFTITSQNIALRYPLRSFWPLLSPILIDLNPSMMHNELDRKRALSTRQPVCLNKPLLFCLDSLPPSQLLYYHSAQLP
jgi:hypothetical protein